MSTPKEDAIKLFVEQSDKWGYVSWHLPHHYRRVKVPGQPDAPPYMPYEPLDVFPPLPSNFHFIGKYAPPHVFKHFFVPPTPKEREKLQTEACFNILKYVGDGVFHLKVNRLGWSNIKDTISQLRFSCDPFGGPSLVADNLDEIVIAGGKLKLVDYRVHLTHENKALRDVLIWQDVEAPGQPHYVTAYIWCFAKDYQLRPYAAEQDLEEMDDPDFVKP